MSYLFRLYFDIIYRRVSINGGAFIKLWLMLKVEVKFTEWSL